MSDPLTEGPAIDATNPPSPKAIAATAASFVVTALLAVLMYLQTDQGVALYAALPLLVVVLIKAVITGMATWIVAYQATDPQRILDLAASPKVVAATLAAVGVTVVIEVLSFLLTPEGSGLYAHWPAVAVVALQAVLPAVVAYLAAFVVADPARLTPKNPHPVARIPAPPRAIDAV